MGRAERNAETYEKTNKSSTNKVLLLVILILVMAVAGAAAYMYKSAKDSISLNLKDNGFDMNKVYRVPNLDEATVVLRQVGQAGDTVLFENDLPDNYNE